MVDLQNDSDVGADGLNQLMMILNIIGDISDDDNPKTDPKISKILEEA